jgi:hypothetical protein
MLALFFNKSYHFEAKLEKNKNSLKKNFVRIYLFIFIFICLVQYKDTKSQFTFKVFKNKRTPTNLIEAL